MKQEQVEFAVVETALESLGLEGMGAADAHGLLVGMLAVDTSVSCQSWLEKLIPNFAELNKAGREYLKQVSQPLRALYDNSWTQLNSHGFEFEPLLPNEDKSLLFERATALCAWVQGFLTGLHLAGMDISRSNNAEVTTTLKDLVEIAQLDLSVADNEENEEAYMEILEYVRMAVLFLQTEFAGDTPTQGTLH